MENQSYAGISIHFNNVQPLDLFIMGPLVDDQGRIEEDVVRMFKQTFARITCFGMDVFEQKAPTFVLGDTNATVDLQPQSDFLQKIYLSVTIPSTNLCLNGNAEDRKFCFVENLGHALIGDIKLKIGAQPFDINTCENLDVYAKTFLRKEQYDIHCRMIGNVPELTTMASSHPNANLLVPLNFFFSKNTGTAFPLSMAQESGISLQGAFKDISSVICCTRTAETDQQWQQQLKQGIKFAIITLEILVTDFERSQMINHETRDLIIEQRQFQKWNGFHDSQLGILHPVKYQLWHARNRNFTTNQFFLAYQKQGSDVQQLLQQASIRFILRFALYVVEVDTDGQWVVRFAKYKDTAGFEVNQIPCILDESDLIDDDPTNNTIYRYRRQFVNKDTNEVIKQLFRQMKPIPIDNNNHLFRVGGVYLLGEPMTIAQASKPVTFYDNLVSEGNNADSITTDQAGVQQYVWYFCGVNFKLTSVTFAGQQPVDSPALPLSFHSGSQNNQQDLKLLNHGLKQFDVSVRMWFNYGVYLDGTGEPIRQSILKQGSITRFNLPGWITGNLFQYEFMPGQTHNGLHAYSYSVHTQQIQPSGYLNYKGVCKFTVTPSDLISPEEYNNYENFVHVVNYNVAQVESGFFTILYAINV